jgi:hypothetical protein
MNLLRRVFPIISLLVVACSPAAAASASLLPARSCILPTWIALTLHLQAGVHGPPGSGQDPYPPAKDIPRGAIPLALPLYPGATPTTEVVSYYGAQYPLSPYLKSDWAEEVIPAQSDTDAWVWYRGELGACGYHEDSGGTYYVNGFTHVVLLVQLTSLVNKHVALQFTLQRGSTGDLVALYFASDDDLPLRPAGSYLPADVVRLQISVDDMYQYYPPRHEVTTVTTTDPSALSSFVRAINSLTDINAGNMVGCPAGPDFRATLVFSRRDGRQIVVREDPNVCVGVTVDGYRPLEDPSFAVWDAIAALVYPHGTPTPDVP